MLQSYFDLYQLSLWLGLVYRHFLLKPFSSPVGYWSVFRLTPPLWYLLKYNGYGSSWRIITLPIMFLGDNIEVLFAMDS